jgi:hypothetical protein
LSGATGPEWWWILACVSAVAFFHPVGDTSFRERSAERRKWPLFASLIALVVLLIHPPVRRGARGTQGRDTVEEQINEWASALAHDSLAGRRAGTAGESQPQNS